jgi:hypothetical protein
MPISSTKRALTAIAVLVCLAVAGGGLYLYRLHRPLAGSSAGTNPDIMKLLPADAPAVAYIDVAALRKLQNSPLAALLGLAGASPETDRDYQNFVSGTGFDYTRDLDRVAIAFWPSATQASENRAIVFADGRFDRQKIKAYALRTGKLVTSGTQSIYEIPGDTPVAFEFLSATRIELASGTGSEQLLAAANPSPRDPAMQSRIDRVAGAPIFAVARTDNLPASFYDNLRSAPQFESLARSVRGLTLAGQPDGEVIHVTLDAECDSMTNALGLATVVDGLRLIGSMALSDPKTRSQMTKEQGAFLTALLAQVKVTHQDKWVRLTLDVTPEMLGAGNSNHADLR